MKNDPVIQFLDTVWGHCNTTTGHSWERLNRSMRGALSLAIGAGLPFKDTTLSTVASKYQFGRWCGESVEWIYTQAIVEGNIAAAQSFEAWRARKPFIADKVQLGQNHRYAHMSWTRERERLAVGFVFPWKGKLVTVTSFSADGISLTACSYKGRGEDDYRQRVEKRFTITRDNIIAERAERKMKGGAA